MSRSSANRRHVTAGAADDSRADRPVASGFPGCSGGIDICWLTEQRIFK
jgi:hypothetical protein